MEEKKQYVYLHNMAYLSNSWNQLAADDSLETSATASLSELSLSSLGGWGGCAWLELWESDAIPRTTNTDLGSVDFMCGWLACATKGALRAGTLFNAFSSCAGGS